MNTKHDDKVTCPLCNGDGRVTWPWVAGYWIFLILSIVNFTLKIAVWVWG